MIKKTLAVSALLCASLAWNTSVAAQEPADEAAPAAAEPENPAATTESSAGAEAAPAETTDPAPEVAAEAAAPEAATEAPAETEVGETATEPATDSASAASGEAPEETAAEPRTPWKLYAGVDQDQLRLSLSDPGLVARFGGQELDSSMLRLRAGARFFDLVGIELHLGSGSEDGDTAGKFNVGSYVGLFVVPTGVLFDAVEVAGMIGLTQLKVEHGDQSESLNGQAYGVNLELPLRMISDSMPDLRIGLGHVVYNANSRHRTYGLHFGLRYDFQW